MALPQKLGAFKTYLAWKTLPDILKGQPEEALRRAGIEGVMDLDLLSIKTQGEFATRFKVTERTLNKWNKRIFETGDGEEYLESIQGWMKKLTQNVMFSFYQQTMRKADASQIETWMQYAHNKGKKIDLDQGAKPFILRIETVGNDRQVLTNPDDPTNPEADGRQGEAP